MKLYKLITNKILVNMIKKKIIKQNIKKKIHLIRVKHIFYTNTYIVYGLPHILCKYLIIIFD